jgi:opacity protein-like surface antigen
MWNVCRIAILVMAVGSANAYAQADRSGAGEVGAYGGALFGPLGGHPAVGGHFGGAFSRYAIALIDVGYMPLGSRTLDKSPVSLPDSNDSSVVGAHRQQSHLWDFNFSLHFRVPVGKKWGPYGIAGAGLLYNRYQLETLLADQTTLHSTFDLFRFGFETGGGVRYYFTDNVGIRTEIRETIGSTSFTRALVGVFYQFGDRAF